MEEELKQKIADSTKRICGEYGKLIALLSPLAASNQVLQQFLNHAGSVVQYAEAHFLHGPAIDLARCKERHDPARLLSEVQSRFNAQEQGFYQLYPDAQFGAKLKAVFDATRQDFDVLEDCRSAIS